MRRTNVKSAARAPHIQCRDALLLFADLATLKYVNICIDSVWILSYFPPPQSCSSFNTRLLLYNVQNAQQCRVMNMTCLDAGHHPGFGYCQQVFPGRLCRSRHKPCVNPSQGHCGLWSSSHCCVPKFASGQKKEGMSSVLKPCHYNSFFICGLATLRTEISTLRAMLWMPPKQISWSDALAFYAKAVYYIRHNHMPMLHAGQGRHQTRYCTKAFSSYRSLTLLMALCLLYAVYRIAPLSS